MGVSIAFTLRLLDLLLGPPLTFVLLLLHFCLRLLPPMKTAG